MRRYFVALFALSLLLYAGCGDVNITINFPAAAIEDRAAKDVAEMRAGPESPDVDEDGFIQVDEKAGIDIGKTNKEIDELKKRMKERFNKQLLPYYDSGNVGEKIDGFIALRDASGLKLKVKAAVKKLVAAENKDREALYSLVAKLNKVPKETEKVARIYGKEWRKNAKDEHYVQNDKAEWMKKKDFDKAQKKKK